MSKKLLHIIATPRGEQSRTLQVSQTFLDAFKETHSDWEIDTLNLFSTDLPDITTQNLEGKYQLLSGNDLDPNMQKQWQKIVTEIERFKTADAYLLSVPMWNFSIPYKLKHYIDIIVQPKFLFQYTDQGVEGLIKNKKMLVVTSRGGDYSKPELKPMDFQEPYLRAMFGFVGIKDIWFVNAEPMDAMGEEVRADMLAKAKGVIKTYTNIG